MEFFRTAKCRIEALHRADNHLEFSVSSYLADIIGHVKDPEPRRLKRKHVAALAATLRFLYQEGTLELTRDIGTGAPFRISYEKLYQIPDVIIRGILGISRISPEEIGPPPRGSFLIRLNAHGEAGQAGFKIVPTLRYQLKDIAPSQLRGPIIDAGGALALMPENAWRCIKTFNETVSDDEGSLLGTHYKILALAQQFAAYDYIRVDQFISANPITSPQSIALSISKDEEGLICDVHPEGVPKDQFNEVFTRTGENIPDAYSIESGNKVVRVFFEPKTREQLKTIAKKRRVVGDRIAELLEDPAAYFELPSESKFWDFSGLSGRITGWGLFIADSVTVLPAPVSAKDSVFISFNAKVPFTDDGSQDSGIATEEASLSVEHLQNILSCINEAIAADQPFLELDNPPIVLLKSRYGSFRARIQKALELKQTEETSGPKMHLLAVANTDEVLHANVKVERSKTAAGFFRDIGLPDTIRRVTKPGRTVTAYKHQSEGISWLLGLYEASQQSDMGCLLADDMGLGKTFQVIGFLANIAISAGPGPTLIVCPTTLVRNWASEIENFVEERAGWQVSIIGQDTRIVPSLTQNSIVITNYEQIYNRHREFFLSTKWKTIFFDEAQKFKNPSGILHNYLRSLTSPFKVAMTGTPVENRLLDLWSIFDVVHPGLLGHQQAFIDTFEIPLRQLEPGTEARRGLRAQLEKLLGAHFLRRTKSLLKDQLPPITRHPPRYCEMSSLQRFRYSEVVSRTLLSNTPIFTAMQNLLMISSHPAATDPLLFDTEDPEKLIKLSGKLDKTMALLEEIRRGGKKVIIFEKYKALQQILSVAISTRYGVDPVAINGDVSPDSRKALVDKWGNTQGFNVLIMSPRTGGAGLTITSANHVIHFTREYNPAVEMQATDRVYRIGQKDHVEVHYPISVPTMETIEQSIECHLDRIQTHKQAIADDFTMPLNEPSGTSISAGSSVGSPLSKLLSNSKLVGLSSKPSRDRISFEVSEIFNDSPEWYLLTNLSEDENLTVLRDKSSGSGVLIYDASTQDLPNVIPSSLLGDLALLQRNDGFLRAIVERILVCADGNQSQALYESAREKGIKISSLSQLSSLLRRFRYPNS
jgi:superfamily II DNA or RNA helicase